MPKINPTNMLPAGTLLEGRYRIEHYLSSGGCGNTYLAKDTKFSGKKGRVVVKEFFLNGITHRDQHTSRVIVSNQDNAALFEKLRRKFRDEADRINELKHPNIVRVSDVFDANHTSYYVMDFISGGSLNERAGQLSEQQAVKYVRQVLQALDVVHEEGLYHLDLKPANVMLDKYDNAILIDFGASKMIGGPDGNTLSSTILYTKGYAPAEQMYRDLELIGPWTDLYAVGATLYNLLTGKEPPSPSVLGMKKESAFVGLDEADPGVRAFVFHCMQSDISKRPHSVAEALYELNHTNPSDRCLAPEVIEINPDEDSAPATPPTPSNEPVPQPLFSLDENKDDSVPLVQGEPIDPAEEPEEAKSIVAPEEAKSIVAPEEAESIVVPEEAESIPVAPTAPTPQQPKPQQPAPEPEDAPDSDASHGGTFGPSENSDYSDNSDYYSDSEIVTNPNERPRPAPQPATPIAPQEKGKSNRMLLLSVLAGMVLVIGGVLAFRSCGNEAAPAYSLDEAADSTTLDSTAVEPADTLANETPVAPAPSAAPEPLGAAPSNAERQTTTTPATSSNRSQSTRQTGTASTNSSRSQASNANNGNAYTSSSNTNRLSTSTGRSSSRQTLDFRNSGTSTSSSQSNASSSSGNSNSNRRTMDFR
ncbi:MAG: protein kinase [Bacteroidaceae bacterium]|nr:protein kinase [Bacteroidaceae bacterium]